MGTVLEWCVNPTQSRQGAQRGSTSAGKCHRAAPGKKNVFIAATELLQPVTKGEAQWDRQRNTKLIHRKPKGSPELVTSYCPGVSAVRLPIRLQGLLTQLQSRAFSTPGGLKVGERTGESMKVWRREGSRAHHRVWLKPLCG